MKTDLVKHLVAGLSLLVLNLQLHAQGFALSSTPGVGYNPYAAVAADVNGDGKMDLISANNDSTITVLTNNGSGTLVSNTFFNCPLTRTIIAADLNGDGKVDLACVCAYPSGPLKIFTNDGSGGFVAAGSYATSNTRLWLAVADINGDGKPDLICQGTDSITATMMVLTNAGNGTFAAAPAPATTFKSWFCIAADVNGDGKPDLIDFPFNNNHYLRILTNAGDGTFTLSSTNEANTVWPGSLSAVDVNGDGHVDVIVSIYNSGGGNTLFVLTNDGTGILGSNAIYTVGTGPLSVATADVNGDGMVDLITKGRHSDLTILTNNGSGFGSNTTLNAGSSTQVLGGSVVAADVNGDGRLDLITADYNSPGTLSIWSNTLTFLPKLAVSRSSNNVYVSWPSQWTGWAGWTLQQNTDLNTANWTAFGGIIGDDGTTKTATNSSPTGNIFFRLSHP